MTDSKQQRLPTECMLLTHSSGAQYVKHAGHGERVHCSPRQGARLHPAQPLRCRAWLPPTATHMPLRQSPTLFL